MNVLYFILAASLNIVAILSARTEERVEWSTLSLHFIRAPWASTPSKCSTQPGSGHPTSCLKTRKSTASPPPRLSFDLGVGGSLAAVCEEYVYGGERFASHLLKELGSSDPGMMLAVRESLKGTLVEYSERQKPTAHDELREYFRAKDTPLAKVSYKRADFAFLEAIRVRRAFRIVNRIDKQLDTRRRRTKEPKGLIPSTNLAFRLTPRSTFSKACEAYIYLGRTQGHKVNDLLKDVEASILESTKESIKSTIRNYVTLQGPLGASEINYYLTCEPERKKRTYKLAKKAFGNVQRVRRAFQLYHLIKARLSVLTTA